MATISDKEQAAEELAKLHEKMMLTAKELIDDINAIGKLLITYFPEMRAGVYAGHQKRNDLVPDEVILKRLNELVEKEELHLSPPTKSLKDVAKELDVTQKRLKTMFSNNPECRNLHKSL